MKEPYRKLSIRLILLLGMLLAAATIFAQEATPEMTPEPEMTSAVEPPPMVEETPDLEMTAEVSVEMTLEVTEEAISGIPLEEPTPLPETDVPADVPITEIDVDTLLDDRDDYYGQRVSVIGDLVEALSLEGFLLQDDDFLYQDVAVVLFDTTKIADVNVDLLAEEDVETRVIGTVQRFELEEAEQASGFDLEIEQYEEYFGEVVIIAEAVQVLDEIDPDKYSTVGDITGEPELYIGQPVSVSGEIVEGLNPHAFVLNDDAPILVIYDTEEISNVKIVELADQGIDVRVSGTVEEFFVEDVEADLGTRFDIETFSEFEGWLAIDATNVTLLDTPERRAAQSGQLIVDHPEFYMGDSVTVRGNVAEALTAEFFVLSSMDDGAEMLVAFDSGQLQDVNIAELDSESAAVEVKGRVQRFDRLAVEDDLGTELDVNTFEGYEGMPFVVANNLRLISELDDDLNDIDAINDDPDLYIEQPVTLEGELEDALAVNAFIVDDGDEIMVIYDSEQIADTNVVELAEQDIEVRITGTVVEATRAQETSGFDLDITIFDDYDRDVVVVADTVELLEQPDPDAFQSIDEIYDDADLYQGQTVTLEEDLVEVISKDAFLLQHEEFLDTDQILVIFKSENFADIDPILLADDDTKVRVTGTVQTFSVTGFNEAFGIALEDEVYEGYEDDTVIYAEEVIVIGD